MCKIYLFSCDWQVMKLLFPNGLLRIWDCHRCYLPFWIQYRNGSQSDIAHLYIRRPRLPQLLQHYR